MEKTKEKNAALGEIYIEGFIIYLRGI